ncbi:MAG: YceI family protein, partial [Limisphaerales bacterium]
KFMKRVIQGLGILAMVASIYAAPEMFDFKDPKGVNNAIFKTDAVLESINGAANGVSGTVAFDPQNPGATTGKIVVAANSLTVPNKMMNGHLFSPMWLDVEKYPEITFEVKTLKNVKTTGETTTADAAGTFTLHGVSKDLTVPVKLTYLPDKLGQRVPNMKGDLLVVRTSFEIKRSEFKINAGQNNDKVSDEINLSLSIAGAAAK